jgi:hypothetical protein
MIDDCFPEQREFVLDPNPEVAADTTRRAGKTYGCGVKQCVSALENPGSKHLYIHLFRGEARDTYWTAVLKEIDQRYDLQIEFNETMLEARFPNGSVIQLKGYDVDPESFRKVLGKFYKTVVIDEAGSFKNDLEDALRRFVGPATVDQNGQVILASMPTNFIKSYFAKVRAGQVKGWSVHHWSAEKNTAVVDGVAMNVRWQAHIERLRENDPHLEEHAWFQQQYRGIWIVDTTNLCYHFNPDRNIYNGKLPFYPRGSWTYALGVDLGWDDDTAFSVGAFHEYDPHLYLVEAIKQPELDYTGAADKIKELEHKYGGFTKKIIDGANKQGVMEMRRRQGLSLETADKQDKATFMGLLDDDLVAGRILVNPATCSALITEWNELVWYDRALERNKRQENPTLPNHLSDATLYMHRHCYQWASRELEKVYVPGTKEWLDHHYPNHEPKEEVQPGTDDGMVWAGETESWGGGDEWQS